MGGEAGGRRARVRTSRPRRTGPSTGACGAQAIAAAARRGLDALVPTIDDNLFMASVRTRTCPDDARQTLERMLDLGQPAAIFVEPTAGT